MNPVEYHLRILANAPIYAGAAPTMEKAADEIERLKRQLAETRATYESALAQLQALSQPSAYERGLADALKTVREAK